VFKPVKGAEGIGVSIERKSLFENPKAPLDFPSLLSEFLDTSAGIPGIVDGIHDLRVALFDGEMIYSYVRTPPTGSMLANVALGGHWEMIDVSRLPQDVVDIAMQVDQRFKDIPHRFYGIDFVYTKDGPWIIEMNAELGLDMNEDDPIYIKVKHKLAKVLIELDD
jgi:glutathione synthase/RimK-type ligase-like ATP-grasp enzyme